MCLCAPVCLCVSPGAALFFDGKFVEAVRAYAQGLALEPENAQMKEGLALAQAAIGAKAVEGAPSGGASSDAAPEAAPGACGLLTPFLY